MYTLIDIAAMCRGARDLEGTLEVIKKYFVYQTEVVEAAKEWKHQGARTKWTSDKSTALWDAVDRCEKREKELESE